MYNVVLRVDKLKRGTKDAKTSGNPMTGLWVEGVQFKGNVPEEWKKFLMDWNAADVIAEIERNGVGAVVVIGMEKEGRFWNMKSAAPASDEQKAMVANSGAPTAGGGEPDAGSPCTPPYQRDICEQTPIETPAPAPVIPMPTSEYSEKAFAVGKAVTLVDGMMGAGIIKGTKVTPELIFEGMISIADRLREYMNEEITSDPKSDASDLIPEPEIPDDDIPF